MWWIGAFEENAAFTNVDNLLLELYLLEQNSDKVKRLLKATAMRLNVVRCNSKTTNTVQSRP